MNRITTTIIKKVEDFKKPALTAKSEDICLKNIEDLATIIITGIIIIITAIETIIIGDGIIITMVNRTGTTRITEITTLLHNSNNSNNNSNNSNNNNRTITIRLTIFRQTMLNQK